MGNHGGLRNIEPTFLLNNYGFRAKEINGLVYPPFYDESLIARLKNNWVTDEYDIFITTHQKVGTHLTKKYIMEMLRFSFQYSKESGIYKGDIGHHTIPWPEVFVSQYGEIEFYNFIKKTKGLPRVWYLHSYLNDLPFKEIHPDSKFIHVYRDPRGVVNSQFHFYKSHPLLEVDAAMELEAFIDIFLEGNLYFGDYFNHTIEWVIKANEKMNIINLKYEDLVDDKLTTARNLFEFICCDISISKKDLEIIIEKTEFDKMKKELEEKPQSFHFNTEKFFRSGKSYGWLSELSKDQQNKIEKVIKIRWAEHKKLMNIIAH
jgi:hypothetical protein